MLVSILEFLSETLPSWEQNLIIPRNRWIVFIWHSVMSLIMKNGSQNLSLMTGRSRQYNRHTLTENNTVALFQNSSGIYVLNIDVKTYWTCKKGPGWNDPMTAVVPRVKGFACYDLSFSRHNKNIKMEHFFLYILSRYFIWLHKMKRVLMMSVHH